MHEKLLSKTHFICPKKAALVTCSLSSLVFFFEFFSFPCFAFFSWFFFLVLKWSSVGLFGYKEVRGGIHRVFSHMCHSHMSLQPRCLMTNSLFQISSRIAVSTCFLLFYSIRVPWTETVTAFWHFSSTASNIFTTKKVRFIRFCFEKGVLILFEWLSLTTCTGQPSFINISSSCRGQTLFSVFKTQLWERLLYPSLPPFWV